MGCLRVVFIRCAFACLFLVLLLFLVPPEVCTVCTYKLYLIVQCAVRQAAWDALNGWVLNVVVSIAVMCPTVSFVVLNSKEKAAVSQSNS